MKKLILSAALALAAGLSVSVAEAAAPGDAAAPSATPRAKMMFWYLDRNGDGFIDAAEITAMRTARFQSIDADNDGKLTKAEATEAIGKGGRHHRHGKGKDADAAQGREARFERRQAAMLKRLGFTDTVEVITITEFVDRETPMLKRADTDGDGKISQAEFLAPKGKGGKRAVPN